MNSMMSLLFFFFSYTAVCVESGVDNIFLATLQKDTQALSQWINYHGHIFGYDNLYMLDGDSSDESLSELQSFESVGVHTFHRKIINPSPLAANLGGKTAFTFKAKHMSTLIRNFLLPRANARSATTSSFIVPLDMDEYIVAVHYDEQGIPSFSMNKTEILQQFNELPQHLDKYAGMKFKFNVFNPVDCSKEVFQTQDSDVDVDVVLRSELDYHTEATMYYEENLRKQCLSKTFFPSTGFVWTDMGNHHGEVLNETCRKDCSQCYHNFMRSGLGLLHFSTDMMVSGLPAVNSSQ